MKAIFNLVTARLLMSTVLAGLLSFVTFAQPTELWQNSIGFSNSDACFRHMGTSDGGSIAVGRSASGIGGDKTEANRGVDDFWVVKLDATGAVSWDRTFGGTGQDVANNVIETSDGGFAIIGASTSGVSGNKTTPNYGSWDTWLVKLNAAGVLQWEMNYGGSNDDFSLGGIDEIAGGDLIINTRSASPVSGNKTVPSIAGTFDAWVLRVSGVNGSIVWQRTLGTTSDDRGNDVLTTNDGNVVLTNQSTGGVNTDKTSPSNGSYDTWLVKIDLAGNIIWQSGIGSNGEEAPYQTIELANGNLLCGGYSNGGINGNKSQANIGGNDFWVFITNSTGSVILDRTFGSTGDDVGRGAVEMGDGTIVLGGYSSGPISGTKTSPAYGSNDAYFIGMDPSGNFLWDLTYGGSLDDAGQYRAVDLATDGSLLLQAYSLSNISGTKTDASNGNYDYWLIKLGSACTDPTIPTLVSSANNICASGSVTLSVSAGTLNDATDWQWYTGSCGGTSVGSGSSLVVSPAVTTTYYARGEGGCVAPGACASITVNVLSINNISPTAAASPICPNTATTINVAGSQTGVDYQLRNDAGDVPIGATQTGNGGNLSFNTGNLASTTTFNVLAVSGGAIGNTSIDYGNNTNIFAENFTLEAWVYWNGVSAISLSLKAQQHNFNVATNGSLNFNWGNGGSCLWQSGFGISSAAGVVPANQWVHVAFRQNSGAGMTFFVNGVAINTVGGFHNLSVLSCGPSRTSNIPAGCRLDNLTLWSTNRSDAEVLADMTTCFTGAEPNLYFNYGFNENGGTSVSDNSVNNFTGTAAAANWFAGRIGGCAICSSEMTPTVTVTVSDLINPTLTCATPAVNYGTNTACTYVHSGTSLDPTASGDNCSVASVVNNFNASATLDGAVFPLGSTTVVWTVTDGSGNSATCQYDVVVVDAIAPGVGFGVGTIGDPFTTTSSAYISGYPDGNYYFDIAGNLFEATVDNTIDGGGWILVLNYVHQGGTNPALNVRTTNLPIQTGAGLGANEAATAAWGHAGNALLNSLDPEELMFNAVTSAHGRVINFKTDMASGIAYATSGIGSFTGLANPANYTLLPGHTATLVPSASLNGFYTNEGDLALTNFPFFVGATAHWGIGGLGNRWEVDDFPSNFANSTIHRTWARDNDPATPFTLSDFTAECSASPVAPTVYDNCVGSVTGTPSPALPITTQGTTVVTWSFDDGNGNISTLPQNVINDDVTPPVITCPANIAVNNDAGVCGANVTFADATATDNCAGVIVAQTSGLVSGSVFPVGTSTVEYTATDIGGNTAVCTFTVTVTDTEVPTIACATPAASYDADAGVCSYTYSGTGLNPTASGDNCSVASVLNNFNGTATLDGAVFPEGTTTVIWTVTDGSGNSATCTYDVVVLDVENPVITCPGDVTVSNDPGVCGAVVTYADPTATDNCGTVVAGSQVFNYTGGMQTFVAPVSGVYTLDLYGAQGGQGLTTLGGPGGRATGDYNLTAGQTVNIFVGGQGAQPTPGYNGGGAGGIDTGAGQTGGGGGGASDIRIGGTALTDRIIVAGGGAGGGRDGATGVGGGLSGTASAIFSTGRPGQPGTQGAGGAAFTVTRGATDGTLGNGGQGSTGFNAAGGGGGGGGYYGGGGGTSTVDHGSGYSSGGGGGSSYIGGVTSGSTVAGVQSGNGQITLTWSGLSGTTIAQTDATGLTSGDVFPVGTTTLEYTATDDSGNTDVCTFDVTVNDTEVPTITCAAPAVNYNTNAACTYVHSGAGLDPTASGDNCSVASVLNNFNASATLDGAVFPLGSTTVVWTVTDGSGNSATCQYDVVVIDTEVPTITCATPAASYDADAGVCTFTNSGTGLDPTASTDNCSVASVLNNFNGTNTLDGATFPLGSTTVVWTVTDGSGNISTCSNSVVVVDNQAPTAICQNISVPLGAGGSVSIVPGQVDNGSFDNCSIAGLGVLPNNFTCGNLGANTVTLTVLDNAGNTATCAATVTVIDNIAPTAVCQDITVQLDATGNASITGAALNNGSTDNCSITTYSANPNAFTCVDAGSIVPVILTVTDQSGNTSTCTSNVTVQDNIAPTVTCNNFTVVLDGTGNATITTDDIGGLTAADACGPVVVTASTLAFDCSMTGANTVTLTATDNNGNTATCNATVTVEDNEDPVITCPGDVTVSNDAGVCGATVTYAAPTATDNCSSTIVTTPIVNGGFEAGLAGWTNNTGTGVASCDQPWRVDGNYSPCFAIPASPSGALAAVTAFDGNGPTQYVLSQSVNVPNGVTAANLDWINAYDFSYAGTPRVFSVEFYDVSNSVFIASAFSQVIPFNANVGWTPVSVDVTPILSTQGGNILTIRITADVPEIFTGPSAFGIDDFALTINSSTGGTIAQTDLTGLTSGDVFPVGTTTLEYTATDDSGNTDVCTFNVTVTDDEAPVANCFSPTIQLDASGNATITVADIDNASTDNCAVTATSINVSAFTCADIGANNVILTVEDAAGNSSTCLAVVTIEDNVAPTVTCNDFTVSLDAAGNGTITTDDIGGLTAADACAIASVTASQTAFTCANVGSNPVTLTVTDNNSNVTTCIANVTVQDNVAPTAVCIAPATVFALDASGNLTITGADIDGGSTDACGIASLTASPNTFTCANIGINNVALTVTDNNGNVSVCNTTIDVQDQTAPVITCPGNIIVNAITNNCGRTVTYNFNVVDACATVSQTDGTGLTSGSLFPVGTTVQTYEVTDQTGTYTCTFNVTVNDIQNPIITNCPSNITVSNDAGRCDARVLWTEPIASDNCPAVSFTSTHSPGDVFLLGTTTVTYTATDASGNTAVCSFTVTVNDNESPTIVTCTPDVLVSNDPTVCGAIVTFAQPVYTENCTMGTVVASQASGTLFPVGTTNVIWTLTDNAGNVSTCDFDVVVEDNEAPVANCTNITIQLDAAGDASITANDIDNVSTDNCGIAALTASQTTFDCTNVGPNTVTLTVEDIYGNTSTCDATVTVEDNVDPIAVCAPFTVQLDASGNATIAGSDIDGGSSDACGIASLVATPNAFTCANVGGNVVTLTVTDANGNTATCNTTVTVQDNIDPTAVCQSITVQLNAAGSYTMTASEIDGGSSDNCTIATITASQTVFSCGDVGANTVTLTVTDVNGNSSTCDATVTVEDNVAPTAVCQDITVQLDATGNVSITTGDIDNGSNDACGIASLSLDVTDFDCSNVGANPVVLTVTDNNGNSTTCASTVTVEDNVAPVAICQDITVQLDAAGNATITAAQIDNGSNDACGIASYEFVSANLITNGDFSAAPTYTGWTIGFPTPVGPGYGDLNNNGSCGTDPSLHQNVSGLVPGSTYTLSGIYRSRLGYLYGGFPGQIAFGIDVDNVQIAALPLPNPVTAWTPFELTFTATATTHNLRFRGEINCTDSDINIDNVALRTTEPQLSFDCLNVGPNPVTLEVTDNNGNTSTCSSTVTVEDNVAPVALCQDITVQLDATGNVSITTAQIDNGSSDACGIASIALDVTTFDCSNVGANPVVLTVTDNNGNVSTCASTVTIEDNVAPVAICQDITVQLDATGNVSIATGDIDNGSNDACGIASLVLDVTAFDCSNVGANPVVLTVTDNNGNTSTCASTVTVEDNVIPVVACQNITVQLDATGNASITTGDIDNGSNDACGIASLVLDVTAFDCSNVGPNSVTLTVTDNNGNTNTCVSTVTVEDNVAPVAICQDIIVQLDATGNVSITTGDIDNGSNDACGIASITLDVMDFDCSDIGANTVTLTVTDNNGNSTTCTSTVTVEDLEAPIITCPGDVLVSNDPGICTASSVAIGLATATDNCTASVTIINDAPVVFPFGNTTVTWTATDASGNSSTCTQTVTVEDVENPIITCPAPVVVSTNAGCTATGVALGLPTTSDNCTIATVVNNAPATFPLGVTNVTWTVTDVQGNTATCAQTVTVQDTEAPVITCPTDITVGTNPGVCAASGVALGSPVVTDNCTIASVTSNAPGVFALGNTTVTWTVTDAAGNTATCNQIITVVDDVNPTIACAADITVNSTPGICGATGVTLTAPITNDNCTVLSVVNDAPATFSLGDTDVTWTVTDAAGNTAECIQVVTVIDAEAPMIICPTAVTASADAGSCSATGVVLGLPATTDNCNVASTTNNAPVAFPLGNTTVIWTVTDDAGNTATCSQTVTVTDDEAPMILCPSDLTVSANGGTCVATLVAIGSPTVTDNCAMGTVVNDAPATYPLGNTTVTWTATDAAGNISTCEQIVTVVDTEAPAIACPADVIVSSDPGSCEATGVVLGTEIASDNCTVATVTNDAPAAFMLGTTTVTWTVADAAGNTATCTQVVTVNDNEAPMIMCPADVVVSADAGICDATTVALGSPVTSDNCSVASETNDAPGTYPLGTTTVTWTVTDGSGNTATCTQLVTVEDNEVPTITCPSDITITADAGVCGSTTVALGSPVTNDNCSVASTVSDAPAFFPVGTTTVTWTVTDGSGNTATCTQDVTVTDDELPVIVSCAADMTVNADPGSCNATGVVLTPPSATDNCSVASISNNAPAVFGAGTTNVIWTVTDPSGNSTTCSQVITVVDGEAPVITCPTNITANNTPGFCGASVTYGTPVVSDNCGIASLSQTDAVGYTSGNLFPIGITNQEYTVIDISGNSSVCSFTVTVIDAEAPTLTGCPADMTIFTSLPNQCEVKVDWTQPQATDNCPGTVMSQDYFSGQYFPFGTTTVTYTATDNVGNTSVCSFNITVMDMVNPTVSFDTDGVTLVADNSGTSYQWIDCSTGNNVPGAVGATFTPSSNGSYAVIINDNGCIDTSSCQTVSSVGIEDITFEDLVVYPNPSMTGVFKIKYSGEIKQVEMFDMLGRVIMLPVDLDEKVIDGTELASGKYMLRLFTDHGVTVTEVVINR